MRRLSLLQQAGATLIARTSYCRGFSCCGARASRTRASVVVARGLSSCGSQALERRLSSCGAWAYLLRGMWDLPGPGLKPVSLALAGGFLTTAPSGKSPVWTFDLENSKINLCHYKPITVWSFVTAAMGNSYFLFIFSVI